MTTNANAIASETTTILGSSSFIPFYLHLTQVESEIKRTKNISQPHLSFRNFSCGRISKEYLTLYYWYPAFGSLSILINSVGRIYFRYCWENSKKDLAVCSLWFHFASSGLKVFRVTWVWIFWRVFTSSLNMANI